MRGERAKRTKRACDQIIRVIEKIDAWEREGGAPELESCRGQDEKWLGQDEKC